MLAKRMLGFWFIMIMGTLTLVMLIIGQMMSFINYDFTVALGLQEPAEMIGEMGVAVNKGFGAGDTVIYLPMLIAGLAGLWMRRTWGLYAMAGALAITAYWPMVSLFILIFAKGTPGFNFTDYASYAIFLMFFTIYGLWGLWYLFANRESLIME